MQCLFRKESTPKTNAPAQAKHTSSRLSKLLTRKVRLLHYPHTIFHSKQKMSYCLALPAKHQASHNLCHTLHCIRLLHLVRLHYMIRLPERKLLTRVLKPDQMSLHPFHLPPRNYIPCFRNKPQAPAGHSCCRCKRPTITPYYLPSNNRIYVYSSSFYCFRIL